MPPKDRGTAASPARRVLTAALLCAVTLTGATACAEQGSATGAGKGEGPRPPVLSAPVPSGTWAGAAGKPVRTTESVLQVVAHPDDDLYFINPEVGQSLRSGRPLTTVFLTSGESDGVNAPRREGSPGGGGRAGQAGHESSGRPAEGAPRQAARPVPSHLTKAGERGSVGARASAGKAGAHARGAAPGTVPGTAVPGTAPGARAPEGRKGARATYAEARQNGIRAAYAEMVTGDRATPWKRTVLRTAGGGRAELDTLQGHSNVRLVWTLLREAGSITAHRPHSLHGLWSGQVPSLASQLTSGGPVTDDFTYTREQVVETLVGYLERFRPTQIRMQDPTPGRLDGSGKYADHQDHFSGARFTQEALADYARENKGPHFTVETYLGYFNGGLPHVLGKEAAENKLRTLDTYAWADKATGSCPYSAGCGDLKMIPREQHHGWSHGIRHTSGDGTGWMIADKKGALRAYSVLDGRIAERQRAAGDGARWSAPELLPTTGIDPGLSPVALPDGRTAVFGTRTLTGPGPADYRREVGYVVRKPGAAGTFGPWRTLGTPEAGDQAGLSDVSAPAVSVSDSGELSVVVRTSGHALSTRSGYAEGGWLPWQGLGGTAVHGDPAVGMDASGRQYAVASTPTSVLAWVQSAPGAALSGPYRTGLPATTGPATLLPDGEGVRLYYRAPGTGSIRVARLTAAGLASGARAPSVTDLGGAGYGPPAVAALPGGRTLLAARTLRGDLATAVLTPGASSRPRWSTTGFLFAGTPAVAPSGALAVTALDGHLYWTPTVTGTPWRRA